MVARQLHAPLGLGDLPFIVGRGPVAGEGPPQLQPDLKLDDTVPFRLSRNHFMIEKRDGSYYVRDLCSTLDRSECIVRMGPDKVDKPGKIGCHRFVLTRPTRLTHFGRAREWHGDQQGRSAR